MGAEIEIAYSVSFAYAARVAALDVYSARSVSGASEWLATGDRSHLPRAWRERLTTCAEKIARAHS
jgi:hypothetical protein